MSEPPACPYAKYTPLGISAVPGMVHWASASLSHSPRATSRPVTSWSRSVTLVPPPVASCTPTPRVNHMRTPREAVEGGTPVTTPDGFNRTANTPKRSCTCDHAKIAPPSPVELRPTSPYQVDGSVCHSRKPCPGELCSARMYALGWYIPSGPLGQNEAR